MKTIKTTGLVFLFVLLGTIVVFGRNNSDILNKNNNTEISAFVKKAKKAERDSVERAVFYYKKAAGLAKEKGDMKQLSKIYCNTGDLYIAKGDYATADYFYSLAANNALISGDSLLLTDILINQSYIYDIWSLQDSALQLLEKALKISESLNSIKGIAKASVAVGNIYFNLGENKTALKYYNKTLKAAKKVNNPMGIGIASSNIGMIYNKLHRNDSAIIFFNRAVQRLKESGAYIPLANTYNNLAVTYADSGLYKTALQYLEKGLALSKKYGSDDDVAIALNVGSEIFYKTGFYKKSIRYLDSSFIIAKRVGYGMLIQENIKAYAKNYAALGNYKKAYEYHIRYDRIKDSLLTNQMKNRLMAFEAKFKLLEKEKTIEILQKDKKFNEIKLQKQQLIRNVILSVSVMVTFFMIVVIVILIQKRKKDKEINRQKVELAEKQKTIAQMELEKNRSIKQELEQKLEFQSRQLTTHALNMLQKNRLLRSLQEHVNLLKKKAKDELKPEMKSIERQITRNLTGEKDWQLFKMYFEEVNNSFYESLKKINPELTTYDLRLAALIKLKLNIKESAAVLNLAPDTVKSARYRLRKKLKLDKKTGLYDFLDKI